MVTTLKFSNALWKSLYKSADESMKDLMSFAFGLKVKNNPIGKVEVSGITNYNELTLASVQTLVGLGAEVEGYPLFAYCAEAKLSEDCPDVLPGYQYTDDQGNPVTYTLQEWITNQNYTVQDLTNGSKGFGLNPDKVSFAQAINLNALAGFTVVDTPTYKGLLPSD